MHVTYGYYYDVVICRAVNYKDNSFNPCILALNLRKHWYFMFVLWLIFLFYFIAKTRVFEVITNEEN